MVDHGDAVLLVCIMWSSALCVTCVYLMMCVTCVYYEMIRPDLEAVILCNLESFANKGRNKMPVERRVQGVTT